MSEREREGGSEREREKDTETGEEEMGVREEKGEKEGYRERGREIGRERERETGREREREREFEDDHLKIDSKREYFVLEVFCARLKIHPNGQSYKTFYGRNLRIFVII